MKFIISGGLAALFAGACANAAIIEIGFEGEVTASSLARASDPTQNAFEADVSQISGTLLYDTETNCSPFGSFGVNCNGGIVGYSIETGGGAFTASFARQPGFGQISIRNLPGGDNITFGRIAYSPSLLEGESDNVVSLTSTLSFRGGPEVLSSNDLLEMYDPDAFEFVQLSLFIDEDVNTDLTVSFVYNLTDVTFTDTSEVPLPAGGVLFAAASVFAAASRRLCRRGR
ncbi:MAG: hypothetical protein V2I43_13620 [Parvularcula sp.]|nr:hypothetical protein [Parvularcula sp.]